MKKVCVIFCFFAAIASAQDSGGIKVTTVIHEDGTKTVTTLDSDQHTSESVTYDSRNKVRQKVVYILGENNLPETGTAYTASGQIVFKAVYKRDGSNRVTEEIDSSPDGQLLRRFVYEYGADGKVSRIRAYDANGTEMEQSQSPAKKDEQKTPPRRRR